MDITCREQRDFNLVIRLSQEEADTLVTLLYQATNDVILNQDQLMIANSIMGALGRGDTNGKVHGVNQT